MVVVDGSRWVVVVLSIYNSRTATSSSTRSSSTPVLLVLFVLRFSTSFY